MRLSEVTSQEIFYLDDYNWESGELMSAGPSNNKIKTSDGHVLTVPKSKCANRGEKVCVVWEVWKGRNGRGGYRVERDIYDNKRIPAEKISRQHTGGDGRVEERKKP